jgi:hypothetical protein
VYLDLRSSLLYIGDSRLLAVGFNVLYSGIVNVVVYAVIVVL